MRRGLLHEGQSSSAIFHTIRIMTGPVSVAMLKEKPGTVQVAMLKEKPGMVQVAALKYDLSYSILSTTTVPFYQEPSTEVLKSQIERYKPSSYPPPPFSPSLKKSKRAVNEQVGGGGSERTTRDTFFCVDAGLRGKRETAWKRFTNLWWRSLYLLHLQDRRSCYSDIVADRVAFSDTAFFASGWERKNEAVWDTPPKQKTRLNLPVTVRAE